MAQQIIDVGATPNDGEGDPIRTAFVKTNENFTELYAGGASTNIANGTSNINILQNSNVTVGVAGSTVATFANAGVFANTVSTTGNVQAGNLRTTGSVFSTGNVQGGNLRTAGLISATGNIVTSGYFVGTFAGSITGNITVAGSNTQVIFNNDGNAGAVAGFTYDYVADIVATTGQVSAAGSVTGGNLRTGGIVSAGGNITGGNLVTGGIVTATGNIVATANVSGGNLVTVGIVSAGGNITGSYILGNGSQLTGLPASYTNANVTALLANFGSNTFSSVGNVIAGNVSLYGIASVAGNVQANYYFGNGSLLTGVLTSVSNINFGTTNVAINSSGGNVQVSVGGTSNVAVYATTGAYVTGLISASGNITGANITGGNIYTAGLISAAGTITVNSDNNATAIVNGGSNASGNIGSSSRYFNTVYATASTALYADLAEMYVADQHYEPGTVVSFGGSAEITQSTQDSDRRVAGVISHKPAYQMNSGLQGQHVLPLALSGRVLCRVSGIVRPGDMVVSAGDGTARAESEPVLGAVIGKALQGFSGTQGQIEVVVGRL